MKFIKQDDVIWTRLRYLKTPWQATDEQADWEMSLLLPEPLASWGVFTIWEYERYFSMKKYLKKSDVLFDVGAEHGWLSVVYARLVKDIVLFEPTKEFWPNIRTTWEKNRPDKPLDCVQCLVGNETKGDIERNVWPSSSYGPLIDANKYQYIHDNTENIGQITIDEYVKVSNIKPTAITIDIEGAEMLALQGAQNTLQRLKPKIWLSIHPDLMEQYGHTKSDIDEYLTSLGYTGEHLATDHEEHWLYL